MTQTGFSGGEVMLRVCGVGELVGMFGLWPDDKHNSSAQAAHAGTALVWDSATFAKLLDQFSRLRHNTFRVLEERLQEMEQRFRELSTLRYPGQASVQVNAGPWIPLTNDTVIVAPPGKTYGGIGGGFATLVLTLPLPSDTVVSSDNTVRFRFDRTDGLASGYRVLAWNFLTVEGSKVIPPANFVEDVPETWTPPRPDAASINVGRELWHMLGVQSCARM